MITKSDVKTQLDGLRQSIQEIRWVASDLSNVGLDKPSDKLYKAAYDLEDVFDGLCKKVDEEFHRCLDEQREQTRRILSNQLRVAEAASKAVQEGRTEQVDATIAFTRELFHVTEESGQRPDPDPSGTGRA